MEERHLRSVEIGNLALGGIVVGLSAVLGTARMLEGVTAGALLAIVNFHVVRRLVTAFARRGAKVPLVLALVGKMAAMMVAVWAVVRFTHWSVVGFAAGLSIFVVSIFAVSLRYVSTSARTEATDLRGAGSAQ